MALDLSRYDHHKSDPSSSQLSFRENAFYTKDHACNDVNHPRFFYIDLLVDLIIEGKLLKVISRVKNQ